MTRDQESNPGGVARNLAVDADTGIHDLREPRLSLGALFCLHDLWTSLRIGAAIRFMKRKDVVKAEAAACLLDNNACGIGGKETLK